MEHCEWLDTCPFFDEKMRAMPAMGDMYRERYCNGDNFSCARYQVFAVFGREAVPTDLYPNQIERAEEIIAPPRTGRRYPRAHTEA